jgi:hypothetical protein
MSEVEVVRVTREEIEAIIEERLIILRATEGWPDWARACHLHCADFPDWSLSKELESLDTAAWLHHGGSWRDYL